MLEKISNFLKDHPIAVTILALLGVASGGVTIYAWLFPPSQKPVYSISHVNIITPTLTEKASGLNITYNGESIDNLTISKIGFINLGKEVIKREDIPDKGRFHLEFNDDVKIYNKRIIFTTENANNPSIFEVTVDIKKDNRDSKQTRVYLDFDYLAHNEGIIIQIAHSGSSNSIPFYLRGTLQGNKPKYKLIKSLVDRDFSSFISSLLFCFILIFFINIPGIKSNKKTKEHKILFVLSTLMVLLLTFLLIEETRPYIAQLTSEKLADYHDIFYSDWNLNSQQKNLTLKEEIKEIDGIKFKIERMYYNEQ